MFKKLFFLLAFAVLFLVNVAMAKTTCGSIRGSEIYVLGEAHNSMAQQVFGCPWFYSWEACCATCGTNLQNNGRISRGWYCINWGIFGIWLKGCNIAGSCTRRADALPTSAAPALRVVPAADLLPPVPPSGLQIVDVAIDDGDDNWPFTGVGQNSPWNSKVEVGDMLIGWSERSNSRFELRWNNNLDALGAFLCDHVNQDVYLWVESFRNNEGYVLQVPVGNDPDNWC